MAEAYIWVNKITTCCIAMVLPCGIGFWLDGVFHISPVLAILGMIVGMPIGLYMLIKMTEEKSKK